MPLWTLYKEDSHTDVTPPLQLPSIIIVFFRAGVVVVHPPCSADPRRAVLHHLVPILLLRPIRLPLSFEIIEENPGLPLQFLHDAGPTPMLVLMLVSVPPTHGIIVGRLRVGLAVLSTHRFLVPGGRHTRSSSSSFHLSPCAPADLLALQMHAGRSLVATSDQQPLLHQPLDLHPVRDEQQLREGRALPGLQHPREAFRGRVGQDVVKITELALRPNGHGAAELLQPDLRPVLAQRPWQQLEVAQDFQPFVEIEFEVLLGRGTEEAASPATAFPMGDGTAHGAP